MQQKVQGLNKEFKKTDVNRLRNLIVNPGKIIDYVFDFRLKGKTNVFIKRNSKLTINIRMKKLSA